MFYDALAGECPLQIDPLKALVGPRPIGWISSVSTDGVANLAPYSFFNMVSDAPPIVMFSSGGRKDSIENIEATGEFVCNLATYNLKDAMNATSITAGPDVDEFEVAELEKAPGQMVAVPRVKASPVALECKYLSTLPLVGLEGEKSAFEMVTGQVVGVFIDDGLIADGRVKTQELGLLARHGYMDYSAAQQIFRIERP